MLWPCFVATAWVYQLLSKVKKILEVFMRYPIGIQTFETIIKENCVYVDKTDLVYDLAQKHICFLSRPRRFGKSLLLSTLDCYFSGRRELFKGLKIEFLEKNWDTYPVFRIDFAKAVLIQKTGWNRCSRNISRAGNLFTAKTIFIKP